MSVFNLSSVARGSMKPMIKPEVGNEKACVVCKERGSAMVLFIQRGRRQGRRGRAAGERAAGEKGGEQQRRREKDGRGEGGGQWEKEEGSRREEGGLQGAGEREEGSRGEGEHIKETGNSLGKLQSTDGPSRV